MANPEFLSDDWVVALASQMERDGAASAKEITVQYLVSRPDGTTAAYFVELSPSGDSAHAGRTDCAQVTFTMTSAVAAQISNGSLSSEEAFLTGLLELEGDAGALIAAYRADGSAQA